jgi:hypothetical protein
MSPAHEKAEKAARSSYGKLVKAMAHPLDIQMNTVKHLRGHPPLFPPRLRSLTASQRPMRSIDFSA